MVEGGGELTVLMILRGITVFNCKMIFVMKIKSVIFMAFVVRRGGGQLLHWCFEG